MTRIGEQTKVRDYCIVKSNMVDELQQQEIEEKNHMETTQEE